MSWGYGTTRFGDPTDGTYRGTAWTYGVDYTTRAGLEAAAGVPEIGLRLKASCCG